MQKDALDFIIEAGFKGKRRSQDSPEAIRLKKRYPILDLVPPAATTETTTRIVRKLGRIGTQELDELARLDSPTIERNFPGKLHKPYVRALQELARHKLKTSQSRS